MDAVVLRALPAAKHYGEEAVEDVLARVLPQRRARALRSKITEVYVTAQQRFQAYMTPGRAMTSKEDVATELKRLSKPVGGKAGGEAPKKAFLREQIEMRVLGLGWTQFSTAWSSTKDSTVGSVRQLQLRLEEILVYALHSQPPLSSDNHTRASQCP